VVVDLVAEPTAPPTKPDERSLGTINVLVETADELLVAKLCTLLSRQEIRDLDDVRALVGLGLDLDRAIGHEPERDAGFSPMTLAWLLRDFPVDRLGTAEGLTTQRTDELTRFRDWLVEFLLEGTRDDAGGGSGREGPTGS
jgi:hypothetical protein